MLRWEAQTLQSRDAPAYINELPNELFQNIIREYSNVSIDLWPNSAINFLLVCRKWNAIGQSWKHLLRSDCLIVNGHDELHRLLTLYRREMIPKNITNLTINLALLFRDEECYWNDGPLRIMGQIQEDLSALRSMLWSDWNESSDDEVDSDWRTLNLHHFSLYVNLSAVSAQKPLLKGWTRHWVSVVGRQLRERGWKGDEGFYDGGFYTYWDR